MKDKIIIRRPNRDDMNELLDLFKETINDNFVLEGVGDDVVSIDDELSDKKSKLFADFDTNGKTIYFLIACLDNKIVGTISYGVSSKEIVELSNEKFKDIGEIGCAYILPKYQKRGIGTLLLNSMFLTLLAKNIDEFVLDSGYEIAKQIWKKKLGEPVIIAKDYWALGVDHHIWHKRVNELNITFG